MQKIWHSVQLKLDKGKDVNGFSDAEELRQAAEAYGISQCSVARIAFKAAVEAGYLDEIIELAIASEQERSSIYRAWNFIWPVLRRQLKRKKKWDMTVKRVRKRKNQQ